MLPSSYHHGIFRNDYQWQKWCPCKRSRSEVKGQGHRPRSKPNLAVYNASLNLHMVSQDIFEGCVLRKNVSLRYKLSWANYFYTNAVKFVLIWICILWTFQKYHKKWGYSTSFFRYGWKYITKSFFLETQSPPNGPWIVLSELLSRLVNKTMCTYRKFLVIILFWTWCRFKRIMKP